MDRIHETPVHRCGSTGALTAAALAVLALGGCSLFAGCVAHEQPADLEARLRDLEERLVAERSGPRRGPETDTPDRPLPAEFGPDPYRIQLLPGTDRYLALLRGSSELLLLDDDGSIVDRLPTPRSPTAWDGIDTEHGRLILVAGELSSRLALFRVDAEGIERRWETDLGEVGSIRDLVVVDPTDRAYLVDAFHRQLLRVDLPADWKAYPGEGSRAREVEPTTDTDGATGSDVTAGSHPAPGRRSATALRIPVHREGPVGAGPVSIRQVSGYLVIDELLDHTLRFLPLRNGVPLLSEGPRITHAGPIWSYDVLPRDDHLLVAAGGVENRPLDRTSGEFGYVDSFLWLYRLPRGSEEGRIPSDAVPGSPEPTAVENLSAHGLVTPKSMRFVEGPGETIRLWVTGYGGEIALLYEIDDDGALELVERLEVPPGTNDFLVDGETLRIANPLLDEIVSVRPGAEPRFTRLESAKAGGRDGERTAASRLGEVLFFTTLMSPANRSEGELSRFTCETCHFEGTIDGRTHFTGRGHVFATTKPLRGLADNVPIFSRAGDEDLSSMIMAEFRVANQGEDGRALFDLGMDEHPWLRRLGDLPRTLDPWIQRKGFLEFLVDFRHRPQPLRAQGRRLGGIARRGLEVFRRRCEHCHQAVTSTRPGGRAVVPERWPEWLQREGRDLIWGAPFFSKTGIEPYVDEAGARVPSLRRVARKHPYFTDGSVDEMETLLRRFRYRELTAWHAPQPDRPGAKPLSAAQIAALLELLQFF